MSNPNPSPIPSGAAVTYACEQGHHGTTERRRVNADHTSENGWHSMTTGRCAGTMFYGDYNRQPDCECPCHEVAA